AAISIRVILDSPGYDSWARVSAHIAVRGANSRKFSDTLRHSTADSREPFDAHQFACLYLKLRMKRVIWTLLIAFLASSINAQEIFLRISKDIDGKHISESTNFWDLKEPLTEKVHSIQFSGEMLFPVNKYFFIGGGMSKSTTMATKRWGGKFSVRPFYGALQIKLSNHMNHVYFGFQYGVSVLSNNVSYEGGGTIKDGSYFGISTGLNFFFLNFDIGYQRHKARWKFEDEKMNIKYNHVALGIGLRLKLK
ncbi:MAG TPA: hypothetical protein PLH27_05830, partial [bacterium]|nr:hypothetical protein [bacterium]